MEHPEQKFTGLQLAEMHSLPNGMYGTAGVLAWPARHSAAGNRWLPCRFEYGPAGGLVGRLR